MGPEKHVDRKFTYRRIYMCNKVANWSRIQIHGIWGTFFEKMYAECLT